jgi:hypothetical protein
VITGGAPKTKTFRDFLVREQDRVTGYSIEAAEHVRDKASVWIYTDSAQWSDDAGSGSFRGTSETNAIKAFYARVQRTAA